MNEGLVSGAAAGISGHQGGVPESGVNAEAQEENEGEKPP